MNGQVLTTLAPKPREGFVNTRQVRDITERATFYLKAGYPVHFSGPAGGGKTTLALHVAAGLGRSVVLIHGDDEFGTSDLVGSNQGYHRSRVVDNFIHSVLKTEEHMQRQWVDNRLTMACKHGFTLVYDEFTRSRPEANNVLLSILEERMLDIPSELSDEPYLDVHTNFSAIFTSNPQEYAGVHKTQDALLDRMITIDVEHYDLETEVAITGSKSGLDEEQAGRVVRLVRELRGLGVENHRPTIRACIMLARLTRMRQARPEAGDPMFMRLCTDLLDMETIKVTRDGQSLMRQKLEECVHKVCGKPLAGAGGNR